MYGPPPDPHQVLLTVPLAAWIVSFFVSAVALWTSTRIADSPAARGRAPGARLALASLGGTALLTAPMFGMIPVAVIGSFPTIDKAGSLHFFRVGTHWNMFDLADPGVQLIGVHLGHLWIVELFALGLPDWAAFNAQSFLNLWVAWACTALWLRHRSGSNAVALLLAIPFALNLHQLRDINWYTVEKTSIFVLPLWLWCVGTGRRFGAGAVAALAMFLNVYMGILIAAMGAWIGLRALWRRDVAIAMSVTLSALGILPFVVWQAALMKGDHAPGSPLAFLTQRAALDVVSLWPWQWNRLEGWRAMNLGVLAGAALWVWGEVIWRRSTWIFVGAGLALVLSLGPTGNPVYLALFEAVPGFWRVAKPEVFFFIPWLLAVTAAAEVLAQSRPGSKTLGGIGILLVLGWLWGVRMHQVYPGFYSQPAATP